MKNLKLMTLLLALVLGIGFCETALADGPGGHHRGGGPMFLGRLVQHNMMVQVLSELSKQPEDTIRQQLKEQHLRGVLSTYNVDRKVFHAAMKTKITALVKLLMDNGYLTAEQNAKIQNKMAKFAQRRQIITTLVEKGLADGTITQEQARLLVPEHP